MVLCSNSNNAQDQQHESNSGQEPTPDGILEDAGNNVIYDI